MRFARCLSLVGLVCLLLAAAFAQVNTDYHRGTDFTRYKTYAWGTSPQPIHDSLWHQRIMDMVDGALAGKGLKKVNLDQDPDVIVVYSAGIRQNVSYQGFATGWWNRTGSIQQVVENEGTLVVDMAEPQTRMITWRGVATDTLSDKSEKNIQKLQKAINKMFQKFPPPSGR